MPFRDMTRTRRAAAMPLIAAALSVAAAACASSTTSTGAAATSHSATPTASPSQSMTHDAAMIGRDCGMIPASGTGSLHGMSMDPVAVAAGHNPLITTLAAEIGKADLTATLDSARDITVFAPDNQAFSKLTPHDQAMMSEMAELAKTLTYHVVKGSVTPAEITRGMTLTTLEGSQLTISKMGSVYEVNSADVTCGPLHTANATVYIINAVLMPAR